LRAAVKQRRNSLKRLGLPMPSHPEVKSYWSVYVNSPKPMEEKGRRHAQDTGESTRSALGNAVFGPDVRILSIDNTPAGPAATFGTICFLA